MSESLDRALLQRFEPVIRYTRGELFFPMDAGHYVRASSLWMRRRREVPVCLVPQGELTLERLAEARTEGLDTVLYLKFIEPLELRQLIEYQRRMRGDKANIFRPGLGRLARVGYVSRFLDLLFSLTLFARGRVPGDTGAAAALEYRRIYDQDPRYCYYGRVVRQDGWTVLQYWYFYAFNNWRSGFFGVNDHEADWEMVNVYLAEALDGTLAPQWVAYASHDFSGDDLRRRWDDPEVSKVGEHPVIYAGAGSHASYYLRGEYPSELELSFLAPVARVAAQIRRLWTGGRNDAAGAQRSSDHGLSIYRVPFVDYARGDGLTIGPGGDVAWDTPVLIEPAPAWVQHYRGLWGLYARDPIAGENAPAGPMYERDGTVRRGWYDPVGWAGLDKVAPPQLALARLRERREQILSGRSALAASIDGKSAQLTALGVEAAATSTQPHLEALSDRYRAQIATLSSELAQLRAQQAADGAVLEALDLHEERLRSGADGPLRAHIERAHRPFSDIELRIGGVAEFWGAISIGLLMIGFVVLVLFYRQHLVAGLVVMLSLFVFIESSVRRRLGQLINSVAIALALVSTLVLLFDLFWLIVVLVVLMAGAYIIWENLRELI